MKRHQWVCKGMKVFFFLCGQKKLCTDQLHEMNICQKFQVAEALGLVTTYWEQRSHLPQLFFPVLHPHPVLPGLGPALLCFSGSSTWLQNAVRHTSLPAKTQGRCSGPKQTFTAFHHWSRTRRKSGERGCYMLAATSMGIFCLKSPSQRNLLIVHWPYKKQVLFKAMGTWEF